jgi:hypothetical protein
MATSITYALETTYGVDSLSGYGPSMAWGAVLITGRTRVDKNDVLLSTRGEGGASLSVKAKASERAKSQFESATAA